MLIAITNDDGIWSPGIAELEVALQDQGWRTRVVAPQDDRMGQSAALSIKQPIHVVEPDRTGPYAWRVVGTPADAAHLACSGLLDPKPDLLVSGINHGSNAADAMYSGTVMSAFGGIFLKYPPVAVSLVDNGKRRFDTAARVAIQWITRMVERVDEKGPDAFPRDTVFSINVPDVFFSDLKGMKGALLARRRSLQPMKRVGVSPSGYSVCELGEQGDDYSVVHGSDLHYLKEGFATVTPLRADLTCYSAFHDITEALET